MCCKIPCHLIILVHIQFIGLREYNQIFIQYSLTNWKQLEMVQSSLNTYLGKFYLECAAACINIGTIKLGLGSLGRLV